jgi:hypothetical protein
MAAEFVALASYSKEAEWLRNLLKEFINGNSYMA